MKTLLSVRCRKKLHSVKLKKLGKNCFKTSNQTSAGRIRYKLYSQDGNKVIRDQIANTRGVKMVFDCEESAAISHLMNDVIVTKACRGAKRSKESPRPLAIQLYYENERQTRVKSTWLCVANFSAIDPSRYGTDLLIACYVTEVFRDRTSTTILAYLPVTLERDDQGSEHSSLQKLGQE